MKRYIIAIDEGTTSERVVLFDTITNKIIAHNGKKITQYYPNEAWVEQDASEIWNNVKLSLEQVIKSNKLKIDEIYGIGITNQRETTIAWNRLTGEPIHNAIVWQCRRTAAMCDSIPKQVKDKIKIKTGLVVDSYFSATKMRWILDHCKEAKSLAAKNQLCFGTIDSFLIYKLTDGKVHATDTTNASRTMLVDIRHPKQFDQELINYFKIPNSSLPTILSSSDNYGFAKTSIGEIPILSCIGDQQSSLVGQGCFNKGSAKITYGTGGFLLVNCGKTLPEDNINTINTVGYTINNDTTYAIEGSIFNVGSSLEYLKDTLNLFKSYADIDNICKNCDSSSVFVLPAFTGIAAPYWSPTSRGVIAGLTLGTSKEQIVKSCVESFAYRVYDIASYLNSIKMPIKSINADGGVSRSNHLMQLQSDLLQVPVCKMTESESTSLGAVFLCGLKAGAYASLQEISTKISYSTIYKPSVKSKAIKPKIDAWKNFVNKHI